MVFHKVILPVAFLGRGGRTDAKFFRSLQSLLFASRAIRCSDSRLKVFALPAANGSGDEGGTLHRNLNSCNT